MRDISVRSSTIVEDVELSKVAVEIKSEKVFLQPTGVYGSFTLLGLATEWPRNNFVRINIELLLCTDYTGHQIYNLL